MVNWNNTTGKPLSSFDWLLTHHQAKLPEREKFVKRVLEESPQSIVDIGSGYGLWLDLFSKHAPENCSLIGIDSDPAAIKFSINNARDWNQNSKFIVADIESEKMILPKADVYLALNIFPYMKNAKSFLGKLKDRMPSGSILFVRQYDGDLIRFGPIEQFKRHSINSSLYASVGNSEQFKHYDLDRVFEIIQNSSFENKIIEFETFQRFKPYDQSFIKYYNETIAWICEHSSKNSGERLDDWAKNRLCQESSLPSYFLAIDLVAMLS